MMVCLEEMNTNDATGSVNKQLLAKIFPQFIFLSLIGQMCFAAPMWSNKLLNDLSFNVFWHLLFLHSRFNFFADFYSSNYILTH